MITPRFSVSQTTNHVIVRISAPSGRLEDADIAYSDQLFMFSCKPYYLRLHLPGEVVPFEEEMDASQVLTCDFDKSEFTVQMRKRIPGTDFSGLENMAALLNPEQVNPGVVEIEGGAFDEEGNAEPEFMKQDLPENDQVKTEDFIKKFGYGFNFKKHGELGRFKEELKELFDIAEKIEESPIEERSELCKELDTIGFDEGYFLADYYDPTAELDICRQFQLPKMMLTDEDKEEMSKIRKKPTLVENDFELRHVLLGLVDILFAYVYDEKVNLGDSTCESAWTYTKLAPTFSCLVRYESVLEAFNSAIRRSLCYGLYRNFDFAVSCAQEVTRIVCEDKIPGILHILLKIRKSLAVETHYRYLVNNLFMDDYIRYLRDSLDEKDFSWLPREMSIVIKHLKISNIDLDLEELIEKGGLSINLDGNQQPLDSDDDEVPIEEVV